MVRIILATVAFVALESAVFYWGVWNIQPAQAVEAGIVVIGPLSLRVAPPNSPQSEIISSKDECRMAKEALDKSFPFARREKVPLRDAQSVNRIKCDWAEAERRNSNIKYNSPEIRLSLNVQKPRYSLIPIHSEVGVSMGSWKGGLVGSCEFWRLPAGWRLASCHSFPVVY